MKKGWKTLPETAWEALGEKKQRDLISLYGEDEACELFTQSPWSDFGGSDLLVVDEAHLTTNLDTQSGKTLTKWPV